MINILVTGNGFDIAHGLKTSYSEFINFCESVVEIILVKGVESDFILSEKELKSYKKILEGKINNKEIENKIIDFFNSTTIEHTLKKDLAQKCKDNYWLKYIRQNKESLGNHWCELEYIIQKHIDALAFWSNNPDKTDAEIQYYKDEKFLSYVYEIYIQDNQDEHNKTIENVKENMLNSLKDLSYILEIYLCDFLNENDQPLDIIKSINPDYLLTFNYTDTYQSVYKNIPESKIHYVHGKAVSGRDVVENNMVFGITDSVNYTTDEDKYDYVDFQKYYQRIVKKTGNNYKLWLRNNSHKKNVFIYGHSLDPSDANIFKDFVKDDKTTLFIFYYNNKALNSIVLNLIKIFGQENMITFTNDNKIHFIKSDDINKVNEILNDLRFSEGFECPSSWEQLK